MPLRTRLDCWGVGIRQVQGGLHGHDRFSRISRSFGQKPSAPAVLARLLHNSPRPLLGVRFCAGPRLSTLHSYRSRSGTAALRTSALEVSSVRFATCGSSSVPDTTNPCPASRTNFKSTLCAREATPLTAYTP